LICNISVINLSYKDQPQDQIEKILEKANAMGNSMDKQTSSG